LKFWLDPASIAEIVAHIQTYLVNNPINSTTEIETIIHDYLIAHPEIIGGVRSINGETGEVILTADNISGGENVTIKDVLDSLQDQIDDIVASIPSDYQQLIDDVSDLKSAFQNIGYTEGVSANLLNPSELEAGRITSSSSAVLHTGTYDTDYRTTGFMPVEGGKKYGFYVKTTLGDIVNCAVANIWAYNESKAGLSYLGNISYNASGITYITAPANAKYVRASLVTGTFTNFAFVQFSETEGTAPSELVQYQKDIYLNGYVQTAELEATNAEVDEIKTVIDDNFTDVYEPITGGTTADNKYIKASGVVDDISSAYNTTTISASAGDKFKVTAKAYLNAYYYGFFDSTDTLIEGLKSTQSGTTEINDVAIVAPANTAYLVVVGYATYATIKGVTGQVVNSAVPWTGKKWVCVGDSLTERNATTTKNYYDYISEASGITPYIMGVGGTGYVRGYDVTKAFYQRISAVPTDADFVTIFGSGNDLNIEAMAKFNGKTWSEALGTYTDTGTDTICGCVNTCLDNYFSVMVTAPIGIIAPSPWRPYPTTTPNNRMSDYVSALKQIAEYRGVPFLDLYHHANLRPKNAANRAACYYDGDLDGNGDGVHPNALGHQIIASKIYEFVKTLLLN
jgi:lysophospholipase L1-like esterase